MSSSLRRCIAQDGGDFRGEAPAGTYTVIVSKDGFEPQKVTDVTVPEGGNADFAVVILPAGGADPWAQAKAADSVDETDAPVVAEASASDGEDVTANAAEIAGEEPLHALEHNIRQSLSLRSIARLAGCSPRNPRPTRPRDHRGGFVKRRLLSHLPPIKGSPLSLSVNIPAILPVVPDQSGEIKTIVYSKINHIIFFNCFMVNYSLN